MSARQMATSPAEAFETPEGSSKPKGLTTSGQRNSRRSTSAMSSARTRGSVSKDEGESDQQQQETMAEGSSSVKEDIIMTAEPEEEDEDNGGSGESNNSVPQTSIRGRRKPGGKRRRGGGAASSRARQSRAALSTVSVDEGGEEETAIKDEVDDETVAAVAAGGKESDDVRQDAAEEAAALEDSKHARQRSASGFKELAGLGLKSIGDGGEGEPLVPRRTRRGAVSPNASRKGDDDDNEEEEGKGIHEEDIEREGAQSQSQHSDDEGGGGGGPGEEETTEEGVTRCLCGSSDENVGLMIQCETCKCWQHCICMGMRTEEDCPDVYFCEQCRPELHVPLLRLLGVLSTSRNGKKNGSKTQSGRVSAKDAAKDLKEAKEAVLSLAKENEKRRKEGREPVTGWSIAQEQEHQHMLAQQQLMQQQGGGQQRRQLSESRARTSRSQSGDDLTTPKSPPKRRSTMNSRDSAYGWESIPPGLLNEEDERGSKEESEGGGGGGSRKRSRVGQGDERERQSASPAEPSSSDGSIKRRRRMSSNIGTTEDRGKQEADEEEEEEGAEEISNSRTMTKKALKGRMTKEQESKPKHPNQYTARRAAAAAAAAAASAGGSSSPSPSPSKNRLADGTRRTTSLRDVVNYDGEMTPTASQMEFAKSGQPGTLWGMPDHLSHLAYLLPTPTGPDPLRVNLASTKGIPSTSKDKSGGHHSNAIKDSKTDRIIQASPQPFQILSLVEPNTKIKFPGKRTTMGEMKKRVRNILEFVSRLQIESAERERRMKFLGIAKESSEVKGSSTVGSKDEQMATHAEGAVPASASGNTERVTVSHVHNPQEEAGHARGQELDTEMEDVDEIKVPTDGSKDETTQAPPPASTLSPSTNAGNIVEESAATTAQAEAIPQLKRFTELNSASMSLVDELTRELLSFQQRYGTGTSGANTAMASSSASF